jgi:3-hydroxybutyryl-CoA dehydrogenase
LPQIVAMKLAVIALPRQQEAWMQATAGGGFTSLFYNSPEEVASGADALFDLEFSASAGRIAALAAFLPAPVFVNSVVATLAQLGHSFIRINGWPGFLGQQLREIAVVDEAVAQHAAAILDAMGWKYKRVPDIPGLVTPRVIAMIVNEAHYALGEGVSTMEEIDIAMKLGTNYPKGPFEWGAEIGLLRIYHLLKALEQTGPRYTVAPALEAAVQSS